MWIIETFISSPVIGQLLASSLSHWMSLNFYPIPSVSTQYIYTVELSKLQKIELLTFITTNSSQSLVWSPDISNYLAYQLRMENYSWFLIGQFITNPGSYWTMVTSCDPTHCSPFISWRLLSSIYYTQINDHHCVCLGVVFMVLGLSLCCYLLLSRHILVKDLDFGLVNRILHTIIGIGYNYNMLKPFYVPCTWGDCSINYP